MKNALALRYAKALIEALGEEKCKEILSQYDEIKALYEDEDFARLLQNPFVDPQKKSQMVLEILNLNDAQICASIKVLCDAGRLEILPCVLNALAKIFSAKQQVYQAVLYSQTKTPTDIIGSISNSLSSKIGGKVEIVERLWEKDGIKCIIEDLDLEISFSQDAFVGHLKEYILDTFKKGV